MTRKKRLKTGILKAVLGCFFVMIGVMGLVGGLNAQPVFAEPQSNTTNVVESSDTTSQDADEANLNDTKDIETQSVDGDACKNSFGDIGWFVCPRTGKLAEAVDWIYGLIERFLEVKPVSAEDGTPIYEVWKYLKGVTNIVFIIFLLVVIYSQVTGLGISNYGIKRALPKLIVAAVLLNLSFLICSLAVDLSNIVGNGLRGVFTAVEQAAIPNEIDVSYSGIFGTMLGGGALSVGAAVIAFETGAIWMLIPVILGAIVSVVIGFITIALRQAVIVLLIMISPLAIVAYILPNTEKWFNKWKDLFMRMLVLYPMFALLFGASELAGLAIIASARDAFGLLLGVAVQIFPLFFSVSLMKMSGTFLEGINLRMQGLASAPLAANRAWADSHRQLSKQKHLASNRPTALPFVWLNNRKASREAEMNEQAEVVKKRSVAYHARSHYNKDGSLTRKGKRAYGAQKLSAEYDREIARHKNNFNEGGFGKFAKSTKEKTALDKLDNEIMNASDALKAEIVRGERIDYDNAVGYYKRMESAINAHVDFENGFEYKMDADGNFVLDENGQKIKVKKANYKFHLDPEKLEGSAELARYNAMVQIMGNEEDVHFVAAGAATEFDTQKKIVDSKWQKYLEMTPSTKDVNLRISEISKMKNASEYIDAIVAGMRVLNQRGDTDLVKEQIENVCDSENGLELGTHASQAVGNFCMFEVKNGDPFVRRFGKYINLETANVFNKNTRKVTKVTYDEYLKGYHDGEPDLISPENPTGRMASKKDITKLMEGTSFDEIERTTLSSFDDSLKQTFGYPNDDWDVEGYIKRRREIQQAIKPAFMAASFKWPAGSEQIGAAAEFLMGYTPKQKKREMTLDDGSVVEVPVTDKNGNPLYDWMPVWENDENKYGENKGMVEEYYRKQANDFVRSQTPTQILGMRGDFLGATVEHMMNTYMTPFEDERANLSNEDMAEYANRRAEYDKKFAEIQTRYGDKDPIEAEQMRNADVWALKRDFAGRQMREILDKNGTLEQIYVTRKSGAANNARDWLRGMLQLNDRDAMNQYLQQKNKERQREKNEQSRQWSAETTTSYNPYADTGFQTRVMAELQSMYDRMEDTLEADARFYDESLKKMIHEFGGMSEVVTLYKKFKEDNGNANKSEYCDALEEILGNFFIDNSGK